MKLTARQVETAKPKDKPYKLADGGGLYLLLIPTVKDTGVSNTVRQVKRNCSLLAFTPMFL